MASQYKLTYFEFTGLGEPIRLLFHYGGIDFIDNRVSQADWPSIKQNFPLNRLPVLEFDGNILHQSLAISRFVAKKVGLAGDNDLEAYEIDAAVDTVNEVRLAIVQYAFDTEPECKDKVKEKLDNEKLPLLLSKLDSWAKENNGYLANGKLSWADLYFFAVTGYLKDYLGRELLTDYPNLQAVKQNVLSITAIKNWVDIRPADNFKV